MKKIFKGDLPTLVYLLIYLIAINILVLLRFRQFEAYYFDHGLYDRAIWQVAHFQAPFIDHHFTNGPLLQLGDHFTPSMYLFSPVYWFTSSYEALLMINNLLVVLSAFVIFLIAKRHIKKSLMVFAIIFAYTMFVGMQNALISNFHPEISALFPLSLVFYFMDKRKWRWFWVFLIIMLGFKETFVALTVCLGIYLWLKKDKKQGICVIIFAVLYYFFIVKLIIPRLINHPYYYPLNIKSLNPIYLLGQFFAPEIKIRTLFISFATFSFLPMINLPFLPIVIQDYFLRFVIDGSPSRIDLGLHYNAIPDLLMAVSSIYAVTVLSKIKNYQRFINLHAIAIVLLVSFYQYKLHGPLGLTYNPVFYTQTKNLDFLRVFVAKIPKDKSLVMTQNNLAAQMTHETNVMLLRLNYFRWMPDVIAIDVRDGQSANNYWPLPPEHFTKLYQILEHDPNYQKVSVTKNQIYYLKKKQIDFQWYKDNTF